MSDAKGLCVGDTVRLTGKAWYEMYDDDDDQLFDQLVTITGFDVDGDALFEVDEGASEYYINDDDEQGCTLIHATRNRTLDEDEDEEEAEDDEEEGWIDLPLEITNSRLIMVLQKVYEKIDFGEEDDIIKAYIEGALNVFGETP